MSVLKFKDFNKLNESMDNAKLILPVGTTLFHGSGEDFDTSELRVGPYDKVLWTADSSTIAQAYISASGASIYTSTSSLTKPSPDKQMQLIQKSLGINYDYSNIEFSGRDIRGGFTLPNLFRHAYDIEKSTLDKLIQTEKEFKTLENEFINLDDEKNPERFKTIRPELTAKKLELEKAKQDYYDNKSDKIINKIINDKLENIFEYKPTRGESSDGNNDWKLKYNDEGLQKATYKEMGKLFIITVQEPLSIYDYTLGEERESDLTDLDYHNLSMFRMAEKNGFDGIKITDFAQSEIHGNYGHYSIGIFKNSIKKLSWDIIPAVHPDIDLANKNGNKTPEYIEYLKRTK